MPVLYYRVGRYPEEITEVRETDNASTGYERMKGDGLLIMEAPCHGDAVITRFAPDLTPMPEQRIHLPRGMYPTDRQLFEIVSPDHDKYYQLIDYDGMRDLTGLQKGVQKLNEKDSVHWDIVPEGMDFRVDVTDEAGKRRPILLLTWRSENYYYEPGSRLTRHLMSAIYRHGFHQNVWEPGTCEECIKRLRKDMDGRGSRYEVSDHLRRLSVAAVRETRPNLAERAKKLAIAVEDMMMDPAEAAVRICNAYDARTRVRSFPVPPMEMVAEGPGVYR